MTDPGWLCSHSQARRWLAQYESALDAFLLFAQDQLGHLEAASAPGALYVGRRLDQAWRRLEWAGMQWLDTPWIHAVVASVDGSQVASPPELALMTPTNSIEAREAARASLLATGSCLAATPTEPVAVAASLHAARLSFSAYRLNKACWLRAGDTPRAPAYQWWEA